MIDAALKIHRIAASLLKKGSTSMYRARSRGGLTGKLQASMTGKTSICCL